jgi:1-aminocyclopropane-1-carboxylate deaminase/D-cysteine desulfhydrase-like pyridoxal-dependent ACC family enzyme
LHCGATEALSPNHRINRGMGGSKLRDQPSNFVTLCSLYNGAIESNHTAAAEAKRYGWKLESWQDPDQEPVYDRMSGAWFLLNDDFSRIVVEVKKGRTL